MDAVIKVGGSLAANPNQLRMLCCRLSDYAHKYHFIIVPGGARFADVVRKYDQEFNLSPNKSHQMAVLGMDLYAMLLGDIIPRSRLTKSIQDLEHGSEDGEVQIIMPSALMIEKNPLENSWDVTSDAIAAYFARRLRADKLILVTDVDGIFTKDPKLHSDAVIIHRANAIDLLNLSERTSVDKSLPRQLLGCSVSCYVVNGRYPERIGSILEGKPTICTQILH